MKFMQYDFLIYYIKDIVQLENIKVHLKLVNDFIKIRC